MWARLCNELKPVSLRVAGTDGGGNGGTDKPEKSNKPADPEPDPGAAGEPAFNDADGNEWAASAAAPAGATDEGAGDEPLAPAPADEPPVPPASCMLHSSLAVGDRVKFNFAGSPSTDEWHRGIMGSKTEDGLNCGFEDGNLRYFEHWRRAKVCKNSKCFCAWE
eukprot:6205843-Pleurochrysis_carterae.AAC.2